MSLHFKINPQVKKRSQINYYLLRKTGVKNSKQYQESQIVLVLETTLCKDVFRFSTFKGL